MNDELEPEGTPESSVAQIPVKNTQQLSELLGNLQRLYQAILHDTPVTEQGMSDIKENMSTLQFDMSDKSISVQKSRTDPEFKETAEILKRIEKEGVVENETELLYLNDRVARVIEHSSKDVMFYINLRKITNYQAIALSKFKGFFLCLDGLTGISDSQAKALSEFKSGYLSLGGLTSISDSEALALSQYKGEDLSLDGLTSISDSQAEALSEFKSGYLSLGGLTSISDSQALALSQYEGENLSFNCLTSISDSQAKALSQYEGENLSFNCLTGISDSQAKALSQCKGKNLFLSGLTSMSDSQAKALSQYKGDYLSLNGLTRISDTALLHFCMKFQYLKMGLPKKFIDKLRKLREDRPSSL